MIYIKYLLSLPLDIAMKLIGLVVAPIVSLSVSKDGYLPDWLSWFETPDSNMFGLYGDAGFYNEYQDLTHMPLGRWWVCTLWQWRNTAQGFSTFALGVDEHDLIIDKYRRTGEGDLIKYFVTVKDLSGKIRAFEFKGAFKWPGLNLRFRWRLGWKLNWHKDLPAQYVFSVSPFLSLEA